MEFDNNKYNSNNNNNNNNNKLNSIQFDFVKMILVDSFNSMVECPSIVRLH